MPLSKPPACTGCPAFLVGRGYVPGRGPAGARLALLGQGPGETEYHTGEPFIGPAGQLLDRELAAAHLHRSQLWIDNIVRCWLPGNRAPKQAEVEHCRRVHWGDSLAGLPNLRVVVPVGVPATRAFLGRSAGEGAFGTPFNIK